MNLRIAMASSCAALHIKIYEKRRPKINRYESYKEKARTTLRQPHRRARCGLVKRAFCVCVRLGPGRGVTASGFLIFANRFSSKRSSMSVTWKLQFRITAGKVYRLKIADLRRHPLLNIFPSLGLWPFAAPVRQSANFHAPHRSRAPSPALDKPANPADQHNHAPQVPSNGTVACWRCVE